MSDIEQNVRGEGVLGRDRCKQVDKLQEPLSEEDVIEVLKLRELYLFLQPLLLGLLRLGVIELPSFVFLATIVILFFDDRCRDEGRPHLVCACHLKEEGIVRTNVGACLAEAIGKPHKDLPVDAVKPLGEVNEALKLFEYDVVRLSQKAQCGTNAEGWLELLQVRQEQAFLALVLELDGSLLTMLQVLEGLSKSAH